jgi:uncharacterized Tic20 family protein
MSVAEELDKLKKLLDDGTITDEQYERARTKLLEPQQAEAATKAEEAEPQPESEAKDQPTDRAERGETEPRKKRKALRRYREREDYEDDHERRSSRHQRQAREWSMFLHLSLFAGHAVPLGGIIAPIIIWQTQKQTMPEIDEHGKNAVNWIISNILYVLICIPLCFIFVGFLLLIILGVLNIVFPIMAALEANEGRAWHYPLAIRFVE